MVKIVGHTVNSLEVKIVSFDRYMGKEHRQKFYGAKAIDSTCRNHGSCPYCSGNRQFKVTKQKQKAAARLNDWYDDDDYDYWSD